MLLTSICMNAQHVTEEQALQKAQAFMQSKVAAATGSRHNVPRKMQKLAKAAENDAYYVFNVEDNGGFVIVSGDARTEEILGYSIEGNIDPNNMPENMRAWLKGYESQIRAIPDNYKTSKVSFFSGTPIEPIIKTHWGQKKPYNLETPTIDDQHCVTGCVATAMAQVMKYWQYPSATTTTIPSWCGLDEIPAGTAIEWDNISISYKDLDDNFYEIINDDETQCSAVAQLMKLCGMAVHMDYGIDTSGALATDAMSAFKNYFGYQNEMYYVHQTDYSYENWLQLIYNELAQKRPVMYDGFTDPYALLFSNQGHEFIVDGYSEADFFHINWGWDSYFSDGYFRLAVHDYVYNSSAIIGIQPEAGGVIADVETIGSYTSDINMLSLVDVKVDGTIWEHDSRQNAANIILTLANSCDVLFKGLVYVHLIDEYIDDESTKASNCIYVEVPANRSAEVVLPLWMHPMETGVYIVKVSKWGTSDDYWNPKYISGEFPITVDRGRIPNLNIEYTIDGIDERGLILHGEPCKVHYKISSLWEGDPALKAKLCFESLDNHTIDLGHISFGELIEGDVDVIDNNPDINFNKVMVLPSIRFYTDKESTLRDFLGNREYRQDGLKTQVTFCKSKPEFEMEAVELNTDEFTFNGAPLYFDMPAGYYVFKQDGFSAFQGINLKEDFNALFKHRYDRAWNEYQKGIISPSVYYRGEMTCGMNSKKQHLIFDCPSDTPYSNYISETIEGRTVYFPCDQASAMEAIGRGLYQNEVGVFHDGGELEFMVTAGYFPSDDMFFDEKMRLYYYPITSMPSDIFSNNKLYTLTCKSGGLVLNDDATGLAAGQIRTDAPESDKRFAIITYNGAQYLYSPVNKQYLQYDGSFVSRLGSPITFDDSHADGDYKYMLQTKNASGEILYFNNNGEYSYSGIVINGWSTADDGNRWLIEPVADFDPSEALALAGAQNFTVTYQVTYEGNVVATATAEVAKGNTLPAVPASLNNGFVTLTKSGTHPTTVTKDVTVNFTAKWNGPFQFTKTLNDATWYNMHIRSGWYVGKQTTEPYYPVQNAGDELKTKEYHWAFGGDPYHVKIYNRSTGLDETLAKDGDNAVMRKGDYTWDLLPNSDGFVLRVTGTENSCINQYGGANGPLKFWTDANSLTDDGSTFRVEEVSIEKITVTADDKTMVYGDNVPELTYKVSGGTLTGIPSLSTTATKTSDVGTYPIMVKAGSVTNSNVIYVDGTLTITQAPLTVTATSFTITQGDALPDFSATYSGFRNGNTASVLTKQPKFTCSATSSSAPGIYDIIVSEAEAKNYSITYVKGTLTIQEKTAETSSWYNDVIAEGIPVNNYTDETLDWGGWCFYTPEVRESGALPIVNGKLKTNNGTVYDINPAEKNSIVLRNANESKTFNFTTPCTCEDIYILAISTQGDASLNTVIQYEDGSTGTAQQFTISDWYSPQSGQGEVIYGLGRINKNDDSFYKDNYFRLFEFKLSANKSKKATGITFTSTGSAIPTILGVTKGVTVTAEDKTMAFGDNVPELTYKVSGGTLTGRPNLSTTATKTSDVGTYPIMVKAGSVTNSNVIYVDGTLTVTQAPLTVTANSFTITQGDAMPAFTATYSGFRNGNTESVLTKQPKFTCSANSSSTPGTYDIIVSDAEAKNYSMNYVKGTLTVIKKDTTTPVEIADWPHDVIAENLPAGDYTDTALDNWDYVLYTSSAKASDALPIVNGLLTTGNETAYAIDPSRKNSLVLKATNTPRTLNFTTPTKCEEIRLIAISAEGAASVEAVVNYVDGTDAPVCQFTVDDWYNTESGHGEAVYGFDRINRSSNEFGLIPYFRIFEFTISTDADKIVKGITFKNTSSAIPTILGIAKKGYDAPVEMCTVTYAVRYEGKVVATATEKVAKGNTLPVAPASLTNDFVTLTKSGTHPTTVTKDVTVYFTATWNGPFEFSKTLNDAKWYNLHIRSGYYVGKTDSEPYYPAMADEMERLEPAYLWAFGGDPYHVKVYNYTTGFAETLTKDGENAVMRKGDYTWDLLPNNGGFVLRVTGTENTCINQLGGNSGPLQFWTNGNSLTDDGSTFRVEDVTPLIDGIEFMGESDTSAPIYDLSGRRVSAPIKKGIFIINRKKVLVE